MASRCSTALVEPPSAIDDRDRVLERLPRHDVARRECRVLSRFDHRRAARGGNPRSSPSEIAACAELLGRLMPSASIAEAIVLAVYMPPQEPGPGIAHASMAQVLVVDHLAGGVLPDRFEHRDDVARPCSIPVIQPGRIVPP